ncbi:MAG: hypothetical protein ACTSR3_00975 [Candidatus Helarchaeota archaeon]
MAKKIYANIGAVLDIIEGEKLYSLNEIEEILHKDRVNEIKQKISVYEDIRAIQLKQFLNLKKCSKLHENTIKRLLKRSTCKINELKKDLFEENFIFENRPLIENIEKTLFQMIYSERESFEEILNRKPEVLYHGTSHKPFEKFNTSFVFLTASFQYAKSYGSNVAVIDLSNPTNKAIIKKMNSGDLKENSIYISYYPRYLTITEWRV